MTNKQVIKILQAIQEVSNELQDQNQFPNSRELYDHLMEAIDGITGVACVRTFKTS